MPIYEYQCQSCEHEFEKLQKISDEPLKICPACEAPALKKKISAAGFRLSGSGWYETDFKSGKKKNLAGETGSADKSAPKEASGKDKTSESKTSSKKTESKSTSGSKSSASNN